jgi:parallel beta-helix repeat protein
MSRKLVLVACVFMTFFIVSLHEIDSARGERGQVQYRSIVHYVDMNGDDSNDGSKHRPWKSLHYAAGRVKAGDTLLINPGKYIETKQISIKTSGEKEKRITFRGNGKGVIIDLTKLPDKNGFEIYFANYITIENLTVHASRHNHSRGIRLTHSTGSIIKNNTVYGAGHGNIFCSLSDYVTIEDNECYNGDIGLYLADSSDYAIIKNNLFHNNSSKGLHMNGDLSSSGGKDGIISHAVIENNIIYDNGATGINLDGVTESVFRNNLLYGNKKRGIAFFKDNGAVPSNDNLVIHNTIVMPAGAYYAIGLNSGAYRNTFYNNIILTEGNVPCFSTTSKIGDLEVVSDYNLLPKDGKIWEMDDGAYRFGKWQRRLSELANKTSRIATGQNIGNDRHSVEAEIGNTFAIHKNGDFQLRASSPAIDNGIAKHSFGKDLSGNLRPNGCCPDMGAYEYYDGKTSKIAFVKGRANETESGTRASKSINKGEIKEREKIEKKTFRNKLGMEFVFISPGSFKMGIDSQSEEREPFTRLHEVIITKGFYMQTTEVTQSQWKKVMGKNPSFFENCGEDCPVEQVSWNNVCGFIKRLNEIEGLGKYRLPTEAEWEYACRAGTETPFSFGRCLSTEQANYCGKYPFRGCKKGLYREKPDLVNSFPRNAWGLISMQGNVWEWCEDWLGEYTEDTATDPLGPPTGLLRVIRGGGWNSYANACRSGNRSGCDPAKRFANVGFRLVKEF